jgi:hypothetical protein
MVVTDESALAISPRIECGCIVGVMAWDGCAKNSVAAAVAASAAILTKVFISISLHTPGDTSVLHSHLDALAQTKNLDLVNIGSSVGHVAVDLDQTKAFSNQNSAYLRAGSNPRSEQTGLSIFDHHLRC